MGLAREAAVVFKWFRLHVPPIIRENMRCELLCDLGLEEEKYTQNNSESLNALVKRCQFSEAGCASIRKRS